METKLLEDARRHLETAERVRNMDQQLYHIREAHQLVIAAEELSAPEQRLVQ